MMGRRLFARAEWRLTEHFFRGMFDFGILTQAGADSFARMVLGGLAMIVAVGLAMTRVFVAMYAVLGRAASPEPYRRALLGDDMLIIGLPMLLIAFLTLLVSDSLFPNERDFRILGPLPVRTSVVFATKLAALILFNGAFIAVAHVAMAPVVLITSVNRWREHTVLSRLTTWAAASVSASAFTVLAMTAIVGVLMLTLARSRLTALTAIMKGGMLAVLASCVPLVFHLPVYGRALSIGSSWLALVPPAWFVGLERVLLGSGDPTFVRLAGIASWMMVAAALVVAVAYTLLFRHFERLMLRSAVGSPFRSKTRRGRAFSRSAPAFRAVYSFTTTTIARSEVHQAVLVGLSGCGLAIAMNSLIGADLIGSLRAAEPPSANLASAAIWAPFALMFACGLGTRAALALPMEHRANWIFRLAEDETTRSEQLRAVDRVVTAWVVGPPVGLAVAVLWVPLGSTAVIGAAVVALVGLVFVHAVLLDWRRIPFTSSYLPGKRFVVHSFVLGCLAWLVFTHTGVGLVHAATGGGHQALVVTAALSVFAYVLRLRRLATWKRTPLVFEDELPDRPVQLQLWR